MKNKLYIATLICVTAYSILYHTKKNQKEHQYRCVGDKKFTTLRYRQPKLALSICPGIYPCCVGVRPVLQDGPAGGSFLIMCPCLGSVVDLYENTEEGNHIPYTERNFTEAIEGYGVGKFLVL